QWRCCRADSPENYAGRAPWGRANPGCAEHAQDDFSISCLRVRSDLMVRYFCASRRRKETGCSLSAGRLPESSCGFEKRQAWQCRKECKDCEAFPSDLHDGLLPGDKLQPGAKARLELAVCLYIDC